ncbi:MAG TPA: hypothetical protein VJ124_05065 [Pyrinomonadaceae bacterium]|nr:hypothetical protein [Pyrinomonadaceae bacterium]
MESDGAAVGPRVVTMFSLPSIVQNLDEQIMNDPSFGPEHFAQLVTLQRELGLLHGDRPTCPFLRPQLLGRKQYESIRTAAETLARVFEKLVARALENETLIDELGLTEAERNLARVDPGYSRVCVSSRLDAYVTDSGFQFLEYNAESPAGVGDQMQLEKILLALSHTKQFLREHEHWLPQPHRQLLRALLGAYRETGGQEHRPQIAIVDWENVATRSEFRVLQQFFELEGHPTIIVDPHDLQYDGKRLTAGDFRIDILYKRVVIHEFLALFGEDHPMVRAYREGRVCMANSFRAKMVHKKASFAILSDPKYQSMFSPEELEIVGRHIPWTRSVRRGRTTFSGVECDLIELLRRERERFVLKPNDDYGGHGVFIGWEMDAADWEGAIKISLERPHVAQERVPIKKLSIPMFTDRLTLEEMFIDFNPFLFDNQVEGALVRLSPSSLLNVTSGGGQTALVVLENM